MNKILLSIGLSSLMLLGCTSAPYKMSEIQKQNIERSIANDASTVSVNYVSLDGRYIGVFEEVIQDGSGFHQVHFRILDILNDVYILNQSLMSEEVSANASQATFAALRAQLVQISQDLMTKNGLVAITDDRVTNLVQDLKLNTTVEDAPMGEYLNEKVYGLEGSFTYNNKEIYYSINHFNHRPANVTMCEGLVNNPENLPVFSLVLNDREVYKDKTLPKSRGCVYGYNLQKVLSVKGNLVAFVRYSRFGFEGPDFRTILVGIPANKINLKYRPPR